MNWQALNLAAPEFEVPPEPPSLCGLIYDGQRHLVSGPPETAKTLFSLIVGLHAIRRGGAFAMIDFESGPHKTRGLLTDLGATPDEIRSVYYVAPDNAPDDDDIAGVVNAGVTLAIIDAAAGAYGVSGLDDNNRQDAETFGAAWIDPLWETGIATLLIDHVTKNADTRGKFSIGSERKAGRTDVHLGLEAVNELSRGGDGLFKVSTHKDRPGWLPRPRAAELHLRSDPATHLLTWEFVTGQGGGRRPTVLMARVAEYLSEQGEPISRYRIERAGLGKNEYVRQALDALVAEGHVTESEGARNARLYELVATSPHIASTSPGRHHLDIAPPSKEGDVRGEDDAAPRLGEVEYPLWLAEQGNKGVITAAEFDSLYELHKLVEGAR